MVNKIGNVRYTDSNYIKKVETLSCLVLMTTSLSIDESIFWVAVAIWSGSGSVYVKYKSTKL